MKPTKTSTDVLHEVGRGRAESDRYDELHLQTLHKSATTPSRSFFATAMDFPLAQFGGVVAHKRPVAASCPLILTHERKKDRILDMVSEFSENLSGEESQRGGLSKLVQYLWIRLRHIQTDTKKSIFAVLVTALGVAALPFIASSQKNESPAQKNLTARLTSLDGFENSTNRTPHRDVENYYVIACSARDSAMTLKTMFAKVGRGDYEARRDDVMQQSAVVVEDVLMSNSYSPHPEVSGDQQDFIDKSRKNPDRMIGYIRVLSEEFRFTLPEVGLTPERIAAFQKRSLQNQISSTR